jgi:hypothetical protein
MAKAGPRQDDFMQQVVRTIRSVNYSTNPSVNAVVYFYAPQLNDLGSIPEFIDLFQFFRIDRVDFKFRLLNPAASTQALIDVTFDPLHVAAVGYSQMLQLPSFKRFVYSDAIREHDYSFVPLPHIQMAGAGSSPVNKPTWLTCTNPALPHYGIQCCPNGLTGTEFIAITARYHLSLRGFH